MKGYQVGGQPPSFAMLEENWRVGAIFKVGFLMQSLCQIYLQLWRGDDGRTAVDDAVLMALVVVVCLSPISAVGTKAKTTFSNVANSLGGS
jgi:pilus assembly protein Flp/PilA